MSPRWTIIHPVALFRFSEGKVKMLSRKAHRWALYQPADRPMNTEFIRPAWREVDVRLKDDRYRVPARYLLKG